MEPANKNIYFRDIHFFIDRITDVSRTKNDVVRQNFQLYFRISGLKWYIFKLTNGNKRLLIYGNGVDEWATMLKNRFQTSNLPVWSR